MLMMTDKTERILYVLELAVICLCANAYMLFMHEWVYTIPFVFMLSAAVLAPIYIRNRLPNVRLHVCCYGVRMIMLCLCSTPVSVAIQAYLAHKLLFDNYLHLILSLLVCIFVESIIFGIGIACVYTTSAQLGVKLRFLAVIFGLLPPVNLILLFYIIKVVSSELKVETEKTNLNAARHDERICATKYPILFVHGIFLRDFKYFNYWGRIPAELEKNGATVYYGNHHSAATVSICAAELDERIRKIVEDTGCEKVNVIAHSKGGLDMRHAMHYFGTSKYVASFTTVNTPHRGSSFADYMIDRTSRITRERIAKTYNKMMSKLGDSNPDLLAAVFDLTTEICTIRDKELTQPEGIYCVSFGSKMNRASSAAFPFNFSFRILKKLEAVNDGLVGESSFKYGDEYTLITVNGRRGVGHSDMTDLNRENFDGFDVREFYVQHVKKLKDMGL